MRQQGAARITLGHGGESSIATGVAVLDHLLGALAEAGGFDLRLEIAPDDPEKEVGTAGATLGEALLPRLGRRGVGIVAAHEALAMVVVEVSGNALVASNADLTSTRAGGLRTDLAASFFRELAEAAGLTIHVRLFEGEDSQHVLEAIFKALGAALADACADSRREE
ncbi:MAG: imidazoleglycerol-phosphate dehydratase [Actinobacteria bacterium]|nr:imidazoleglycerol-phosphate dehydratase [Actinomycetota bacterium]